MDEVNELVKPSDEALHLVREWLHEHVDLKDIESSPAGDFMSFTIPITKVEKLLKTKYSVYRHTDGSTVIRTPEWKLPLHLHDHITAVQPTTSFFRTVPQAKTFLSVSDTVEHPEPYQPVTNPTVGQVCDTAGVTPLCLRTLYET